jgi:NADPH2:quinone reductase
MKAVVMHNHGTADELVIEDVPIPQISDHEVLLEVKAFALNRLDIWTRDGMPSLKLKFPHIGSSDFSGVVKEIGDNVSTVKVGDRVHVNAGISCKSCYQCKNIEESQCDTFHLLGEHVNGGAAEFAKVPETNLSVFPDHISFEEAAAVPLTALTVYRMLKTRARLKSGETVLVIGAGGGIGVMGVQIAKALGGSVIALTSTKEKEEKLKTLGADHIINYRENPDWGKAVFQYTRKRGVDVVVDSTGDKVWENAVRSLAKGGRLVTCGSTSGPWGKTLIPLVFWKQLSILGSTMASDKEFREAMNLFYQGKINPVIDRVYPMEETRDAHKRMETGEHMGKIVIKVSD